jgi:hypothetical protein
MTTMQHRCLALIKACQAMTPRLLVLALLAPLALVVPPALAQTPAASSSPPAAPTVSRNVAPGFPGLSAGDKVVLMPVDVELFSLSAGGVLEPKADWTAAAQRFMSEAVAQKKVSWKLDAVTLTEAQANDFAEQVGLHAAVAGAISLHHFGGNVWALPTKGGQLDWSFADAMKPLQDKTGARYGLFLWVRDSYASAERKAAMVMLALVGVGITGGFQVGYASLVDLQTGQVLWFNRLIRAAGDLREAAPARESIDLLLAGFPAGR